MQTASLADLWAAYNFIKSEISIWQNIVEIGKSESENDLHRFIYLRGAAKTIYYEIGMRMDTFIQPPIKA